MREKLIDKKDQNQREFTTMFPLATLEKEIKNKVNKINILRRLSGVMNYQNMYLKVLKIIFMKIYTCPIIFWKLNN